MLESHNRQQEYKRQQARARMRDMATMLDGFGCILLNNLYSGADRQVMHMQDIFPELYRGEQPTADQDTGSGRQEADMEVYKAARLYQAYCFNRQRRGKH